MRSLGLLFLALMVTGTDQCFPSGVGCGCPTCPPCPPPPVQSSCQCGGSAPSCNPCSSFRNDAYQPSPVLPQPAYVPPPPSVYQNQPPASPFNYPAQNSYPSPQAQYQSSAQIPENHQPIGSAYVSAVAENTQTYPTANNNYPQIPPSPQMFGSSESSSYRQGYNVVTNRIQHNGDTALEQAVQYYNKESNENIKSPPKDPSRSDFNGLPSIYYQSSGEAVTASIQTTKNMQMEVTEKSQGYDQGVEGKKEVDSKGHEPAEASTFSPAPTAVPIPKNDSNSYESPPSSSSSSSSKSSDSKAYASGTFVAAKPLDPQTEYHMYEAQVCAGVTMGRSTEPNGRAAAEKCAAISCAAANMRPLLHGQYEVIYLKTVDLRKFSRSYDCISSYNVTMFGEESKGKRELEKQLERRDRLNRVNGAPSLRIRPTTVEPKGHY
ncbi:unnamed protein product [Bursaphelenchus xylophilus]|uniref:(pine wood nematode) hypothetical protein n=1 Tax=Bursaphelenchus xylophilus TaxID=6326 RepID=A0A1I7RLJ9_BURXY|nr:unnamed protein product [Bursaphelenchus xylophilus]CAG9082905.1 unnamed protein product [Bursaphelenchus xylophilus]